MTDRRRGLGKGLGALIPSGPGGDRPTDVFFPRPGGQRSTEEQDRAWDQDHGMGVAVLEDSGVATGARAETDGFTGNTDGSEDGRTVGASGGSPSDLGLGPVPGATFAEVPVDAIRPNPRQPRQVFDEDELAELVASISELGVLQPVVVRAVNAEAATTQDGDPPAAYELVMGERRLRASRDAGLTTIPAIIRSTDDEHMLRDALLENLHRAQLNPLEEAAAYQQLLDDFGCTHEDLATRIGRSRPQITNTIRLLKLPPLVQRRVASGVLSAGHARALLGLKDGAAMERLAQRIVAEGLSVRSVEEIVVLGEDRTTPRPRGRSTAAPAPELQEVAESLSERLETRVQVTMGRRRGKITVEFAGKDDLERILEALGRN
ncbi:ParB/RepB/Spo0J family partition protein [Ornithinimicrobium sp. W1679]|uniref:ParB/RepB/Spo0J family partition protein n=1 Tax=Ornithinimicrobium sp. W1679 TaxID=3418770 RepID=UPI003CEC441C